MPVSKMARNKGTDMGNWVSRKQATEIINATFSMFHYGLMAMPDMGIKNTKEKEDFLRAAWKLDETIHTDDYADTVNALDTTGFKEYYNLIGAFAKKYKIANWKDYSTYEPVLIEHLNEELGRHEKTEEKLELINSFHDEELCSETFPSASKIRVLYDILDDCFVLDNKENGINRILRTFNENDKTAFITKIQSDDKLLASFIKKVNGGEKDEMLATIGEIFISSGFIKDRKTVLLDNKKTDTLTASLNKGKIYIKMESLAESTNLVPGGMGDYPNISRRTVTVSPFDIVRMNYDGRHIRVPAVLLLKRPICNDDMYIKYNIDNIDTEKTIEKFKYLNVPEQYLVLKSAVETLQGTDKGKFAKLLRDNKIYFKLDGLFASYKDFMNAPLRDFLNCKEDGTENYTLNEVITGNGWFEFLSCLSACHQHKHLHTKSGKPLFNAKFGNKDGREVVFNANFEIITGYPDKGTFNYAVPEGFLPSESSFKHKKHDVDPFYPLVESLGYDSGLALDTISWGGESFWNENAYIFGYNTEVWDKIRTDKKLYDCNLLSKEKEFEILKQSPYFDGYKVRGFKAISEIKKYPQSYIDFFIKESRK